MNEEILNKILEVYKKEIFLFTKNKKYANIILSINMKKGEISTDFHIETKNSERIG